MGRERICEPQFVLMVNGQPWERVDSLDGSSPGDKAYTVDIQTGTLCFGDGEHGRIPPDGSTFQASYRYSGGAEGNVTKGITVSLAWNSRSFSTKEIITVLVEPRDQGIVFRSCRRTKFHNFWRSITKLCRK